MSSDGENIKNQPAEAEKTNLDTTDSSQDSQDADVKAENDESQEKPADAEEKPKNDTAPKPADKEDKPDENDSKPPKEENDVKEKNDVDVKKDEKKAEEKTDDDTEEGDGSEGDDEDKGVPLLDQPLEMSGTRERKKVQRFNEEYSTEPKESTKIEIPTGNGTQLGEIPRIDASIARFKTDDLKNLHKLLFRMPGKATQIKKNIKKFNGFDFTKGSDAYTRKVQSVAKMELKQLKSICEMLDLEKKGNRDEIAERVCTFLLEPKDSGKPVGGGRPKRTAAVRANNRGYSSLDDDDDSDSKRSSRAKRGKGRRVNLKEESSSESDAEFNPSDSEEDKPRVMNKKRGVRATRKKADSEEEPSDLEQTPSSGESDEPKSKRKRTPAKVPNNKSKKASPKSAVKSPKKGGASAAAAGKKRPEPKKGAGRKRDREDSEDEEPSDNNEGSSSEDEPLVKKNKSPQPPSDEEIKTYVKEILEGADLEEITMKTVCKQVYAHYPDFDLAHKKDFIKTTVKSLIST